MLCPGSRSTPLALAAGGLARADRLLLTTAIDERSAAFLALGHSTATGRATAVITTSGTAVANLLPALVEADRSCQPLLLLTADRPDRLKDCGANQTVNQEAFLQPACRWVAQGPGEGLHRCGIETLESLVDQAWQRAHQLAGSSAGPVHLNLPLEEPLHASEAEQKQLWASWSPRTIPLAGLTVGDSLTGTAAARNSAARTAAAASEVQEKAQQQLVTQQQPWPELSPAEPGVVVAGPWRGRSEDLPAFQQALREWQSLSGWPVLADPLSGVAADQPGLIRHWELLLPDGLVAVPSSLQVLRLGPMAASRRLEAWLQCLGEGQLLITEGDQRCLDPLGLSVQWSDGLSSWWQRFRQRNQRSRDPVDALQTLPPQTNPLLKSWQAIDQCAAEWLDQQLPLQGAVCEPALARCLPRLLPKDCPVMLASSSPVRDWLAYADLAAFSRRCFGFRGASGIDGTLSLGMGLSMALGPALLVSGDLALLHDSNGWLLTPAQRPPLVVLLIDNAGGGIFQQLPVRTEPAEAFEQLFAMPQAVDPLALAAAHAIPHRQLACLEDLPQALEWAFAMSGPVLLRVCTNRQADAALRKSLHEGLANHLQATSQNGLVDC